MPPEPVVGQWTAFVFLPKPVNRNLVTVQRAQTANQHPVYISFCFCGFAAHRRNGATGVCVMVVGFRIAGLRQWMGHSGVWSLEKVKLYFPSLESHQIPTMVQFLAYSLRRLSYPCYSSISISTQRPRGLRRGSAPARLLGMWVRIPPGDMDVCLCILAGRGLRDELITLPEEFYRLWCVVVCDLESW